MQTNEKRKNTILKIIFLLIILIALAFLAKYAWAKYMSISGNQANAEIARWVFKVNGNDTQTTNVANFAITRKDNDNDSVKQGVIAPGTEGVFDIVIDATGTDTMLQYFIDITLIKKPENLKFYLKDENTDEKIFLETEDNHLKTKGFMSLNDSKERTERLYWIWELETGSNANEILINDKKDSEWIGKTMEMQISVTGMQSLGPGDVEMLDGTMAKYDFSEVSWYNINSSTLSGVNTNEFIAVPHNVAYGNNYLEFNGTNSWVNLGEINSDYMTLEVTFMADSYATASDWYMEKHILSNIESGGITIQIYNNKIRGAFCRLGDSIYTVMPEIDFELGKIYNVIYTYDGSKCCIYLNGEKKSEIEIEGKIKTPISNTIMCLGDNPYGQGADIGPGSFDGKIYSAAVYNRGLTEDEAAQNAQIALNKANNN